jgi:hypothetical protein
MTPSVTQILIPGKNGLSSTATEILLGGKFFLDLLHHLLKIRPYFSKFIPAFWKFAFTQTLLRIISQSYPPCTSSHCNFWASFP